MEKKLILDLWGPLKCGGPGHVPALKSDSDGVAKKIRSIQSSFKEFTTNLRYKLRKEMILYTNRPKLINWTNQYVN